jgi:hypothetical protein
MAREKEREKHSNPGGVTRFRERPTPKCFVCTQAAITKQAFAERDIFALGLMKFAYQEIIMELLQRERLGRGRFCVFAFLVCPCECISIFDRPRTPSKHNSLFIPLLQIELLRKVSLFLVGAPRNDSAGKQSSLLRSETLANVMCLHIGKLSRMNCLLPLD